MNKTLLLLMAVALPDSALTDIENIYFADKPFAAGDPEAIEHDDFFRECKVTS